MLSRYIILIGLSVAVFFAGWAIRFYSVGDFEKPITGGIIMTVGMAMFAITLYKMISGNNKPQT